MKFQFDLITSPAVLVAFVVGVLLGLGIGSFIAWVL